MENGTILGLIISAVAALVALSGAIYQLRRNQVGDVRADIEKELGELTARVERDDRHQRGDYQRLQDDVKHDTAFIIEQVRALTVEVAKNYMPRSEFQDCLNNLERKMTVELGRQSDKLDAILRLMSDGRRDPHR